MMELSEMHPDYRKKSKLQPRSRSSAAHYNGMNPLRHSPEPLPLPAVVNKQPSPAKHTGAAKPDPNPAVVTSTKSVDGGLRAIPSIQLAPVTPPSGVLKHGGEDSSRGGNSGDKKNKDGNETDRKNRDVSRDGRDGKDGKDGKDGNKGSDKKGDVRVVETTTVVKYDPNLDKRMSELMTLWKQFQVTVQDYNRRTKDLDQKMNNMENNVDRFGKFCGEYQLIWKIKNFAACYEDAVTERRIAIPSPVFDTHRNGYKLQLSLCPNGDGKGKGQWMSLFFAILKGPYDNLLQWPFTCPVTMALLEQVSDPGVNEPRDVAMTFTPNPRPDNEPFLGQPKTERNLSLGFPKFIALKELFDGEYIKDDAMFIKVRVDLTDVIVL